MFILSNALVQIKKYREYIIYAIRSELKLSLAGTYLGYVWWVLDPLMYMLVYVLVVQVIFERGGPLFPVYVFCGLLPWKWTSTSVVQSTSSIKSNASILSQVYMPKFILPLIKISVNAFYFLFGFIVLLVLLLFYGIPYSFHFFEVIFVVVPNFMFLLGMGFVFAHIGVYFKDIQNILTFTIRFWFYLSPILYDIVDIPDSIRFLWWLNPMTTFFISYRNVLMYNTSPLYLELSLWFLFSVSLSYIGLKLMYAYDKNYVKVI